jgi:hypothetical protein
MIIPMPPIKSATNGFLSTLWLSRKVFPSSKMFRATAFPSTAKKRWMPKR